MHPLDIQQIDAVAGADIYTPYPSLPPIYVPSTPPYNPFPYPGTSGPSWG